MRVASVVLFLVLSAGLSVVPADARSFEADEEVKIDADEISYDQRNDTINARGDVRIHRGETELRAEEIMIDRRTNEATARGAVSFTDPEGIAQADEVRINLDDETGVLDGVSLRSRRLQYSLSGSRIEKHPGQSYTICNGQFTTCNCESGRQDWSISSDRLDVTLDGYGVLRGATFNVLDVPVLYLPRAIIPVNRTRQSGFLMPRFGASNRRGFQTLLPFYWAISKSQDATIAFDVETAARIGMVSEYRYALSRRSSGNLSLSYFNEDIRTDESGSTPEDRWGLIGDQRFEPWESGYAYTEASWVGDDEFFRDMNTYAFEHQPTVLRRTQPYTSSNGGFVQGGGWWMAQAEASYRQDLTGGDAETLHTLPRLDLLGQVPIGPVIVDTAAQVVNYQRSRGADGVRADVAPRLTLALPLGPYAYGSLQAGVRETAYALGETELGPEAQGARPPTVLERHQNRETAHVSARVSSSFGRVYSVDGALLGFDRLKHTVEPLLGYLFVPAVNQGDLPLWDGEDRINHRNLITYGAVSRLIGRAASRDDEDSGDEGKPRTRELARFSLMQSYDLDRRIPAVREENATDHLSDIDIAARANPSKHFSVRLVANYDPAYSEFLAARVGFFAENPWEGNDDSEKRRRLGTHTGVGVSYRFLTNNLVHEVDTNLVLRLTEWAGFLYASRYSVTSSRFLDNFFGVRLISQCDCWALDVAVTNRNNPSETEARAQLTLVGLNSQNNQMRRASMP